MRMQQAVLLNVPQQRKFSQASMRGTVHPTGAWGVHSGRLSGDDLDQFNSDQEHVSYIVWSYATPIAWYRESRGWHVVEEKFSPTTSRHQSYVRQAVAFAARRAHFEQAV